MALQAVLDAHKQHRADAAKEEGQPAEETDVTLIHSADSIIATSHVIPAVPPGIQRRPSPAWRRLSRVQ